MFFVSAVEKSKNKCNIFVTDTRDLVTECYSYNKLVSILDSTDFKVHGVCKGIGLPFVENFNLQTCYLTNLDDEDSYSTWVDGIDIFFGRDASFVNTIMYYMEQGLTEYTTFYDTECQGLYGLIKCLYQMSRTSWDTDNSIYNTGFFSKDSDTAILIFLRNVYNYRNGLPLLPLDIEKSGTKLVPDIEDIECVVYGNFVYYIYDDVVMRVGRHKV